MTTRSRSGRSRKAQSRPPPKVVGMSLGRVIATRRLTFAAGPDATVTVQLGPPRKTRGLDEHSCPYRIVGLGDGRVRSAFGVDAFQALHLAFRAIEAALAMHPGLRWLGNLDLGFACAPQAPGPGDRRLDEIRARVDAASPGPWRAFVEGRDHTSGSSFIQVGTGASRREDIEPSGATPADHDFIAHARQDVPALLDEVQRLRTLVARRRAQPRPAGDRR